MDYEALIRTLCEPFVENEDSLNIRYMDIDERGRKVYLIVADDEDVARLVGKGGKNVRSIRDIVDVAAHKNGERVDIKVDSYN